jgi:diguanylate cyclase (GGDEF)-like protein
LVVLDDEGTVAWSNKAAERLLGGSVQIQIGGRFPFPVTPEKEGQLHHLEDCGQSIIVDCHFHRVERDGLGFFVVTVRDVTAHVQRSLQDEMTGLPNRRGFLFLAQQHVKIARRQRRKMHLLFVDIDNLKGINDTHGHAVGDAWLVEVAQSLRVTFRVSDLFARWGGDEFLVLALDTKEGSGDLLWRRLDDTIEQANNSGRVPGCVSLSVGTVYLALYLGRAPNADSLILL